MQMPLDKNLAGLLGLCRKAGKLSLGMEAVSDAVRQKKAKLILISGDCGVSTMREAAYLSKKVRFGQAVLPADKAEIGPFVGIKAAAVMAVLDDGFAEAVLSRLNKADEKTN